MTISAVAASDRRVEVFRITSNGRLLQRWLDLAAAGTGWSGWHTAPIEAAAVAVAAISGWDEQIEVFVLDNLGRVWNRWWWQCRGWTPTDGFNLLGAPFGPRSRDLSAFSAGHGHFNVFVEAPDGELAVLPHVNGPNGPFWQRCTGPRSLGDGWWPAFSPPDGVYRMAEPPHGPARHSSDSIDRTD
jgi:hypothetical protein